MTLVPNLSFVVRAAANAMATTGSGHESVIFSDSHSESNRRASRVSTRAENRSASLVTDRVPSPYPTRIFMPSAPVRAGSASSSRVRRSSSSLDAELAGREVGDAGIGQPADACGDRGLVADDGDVGRALGAFAVEHRPVAGELAVDGVGLRGPRPCGRRRRR